MASVGASRDVPEGVQVVRINAEGIVSEALEVAEKVWGEFVLEALKTGQLSTRPKPLLGHWEGGG
jgi:hypothetical protein